LSIHLCAILSLSWRKNRLLFLEGGQEWYKKLFLGAYVRKQDNGLSEKVIFGP